MLNSFHSLKLVVMPPEEGPRTLSEKSTEEMSVLRENTVYLVPKLLPPALCARFMARFYADLKPYKGRLMRVSTAVPERHEFDESGLISNAVSDLHFLSADELHGLRDATLDLMTDPRLRHFLETHLNGNLIALRSSFSERPASHSYLDTVCTESGYYVGIVLESFQLRGQNKIETASVGDVFVSMTPPCMWAPLAIPRTMLFVEFARFSDYQSPSTASLESLHLKNINGVYFPAPKTKKIAHRISNVTSDLLPELKFMLRVCYEKLKK